MKKLKRLFSLSVALSFLILNMNSVIIHADETEIAEDAQYAVYDNTDDSKTADEISVQNVVSINQEIQDRIEAESLEQDDAVSEDILVEADEIFENLNAISESSENEASAVYKGEGDIEGLVDTKIFQVTLPVQGNAIDYTADPQGLIYKTSTAKHPDANYDSSSNVYFNNGTKIDGYGKEITYYSGTSNPLTIVNKSSCAVTVVARVSAYYEQKSGEKVVLSSDTEWDGVKRPSIYLAVVRSDETEQTPLSQKEKIITTSIAGCPGAYKTVYENEVYNYRLMSDEELSQFRLDENNKYVDTNFKEFSLYLTGECNGEGKWDSNVNYSFPSPVIVWNVGFAATAKPCISKTDYSVAYSDAFQIPYSLGAFDDSATEITSIECSVNDAETIQILGNDDYCSVSDDTISFSSEFAEMVHSKNGAVLKITFNDPKHTEVSVTLDNSSAPFILNTEYTIPESSTSLEIGYDLGVGEKAAAGIESISFGTNDFNNSAYTSIDGRVIRLSTAAIRSIANKGGGKIKISFNDDAHTRVCVSVRIK